MPVLKKWMPLIFILCTYVPGYAQSQDYHIIDSTRGWPPVVEVDGDTFLMNRHHGIKTLKQIDTVVMSTFLIGKYEVSQSLWQKVMGDNPSAHGGCPDCPIEQVSPERIDTFIRRLNALTGNTYRLPTEAEWEYASRGGKKSKGYIYSGSNDLAAVGWYKENSGGTTHTSGTKQPNELGIYDMTGNVWELCSEWYDQKHNLRIVRGGSWRSGPERCPNNARNRNIKDHRKGNNGFRLVLVEDKDINQL